MKKNCLNYAFVDPASGGYSASRIASLWLILIDTIWMFACIKGIPPKEAYVPVSGFLGTCTSVAFAAYGLNSFAGGWKHNVSEIASSVFSKTTTTSQVDSGPTATGPGPKATKTTQGE